MQFVEDHFVESYYPTIENTFSKIIKYKGQEFSTEIIDTAGQVSLELSCLPTTTRMSRIAYRMSREVVACDSAIRGC